MGFKEAIKEYGKQLSVSFVCDGVTYSSNQVASFNPHYDGRLLTSVMRCLDIELDGVSSLGADTIQSVTLGVRAPGDSTEYQKDYGTYIIKESAFNEDTNSLNLECYDLMLRAMIPYDINIDYDNNTITVSDLLDAICARLGWEKGYTTFANSAVAIDEEKYDATYTFRDVLDEIAQVAAGTIAFKNDKLCVIYPTDSGETVDCSNLKRLQIGEKYGPINSVVLARTPQEDNIYKQDAASIEENGLTEFKIENNQIMDSHRDDFIQSIYDQLNGVEFYLYEFDSFGIGSLDLGDKFTLEALDNTTYQTIMLADDLSVTKGLSEASKMIAPKETKTDYSAASETERTINQTLLRVNKQEGTITGLVSKTTKVEDDISGLQKSVTDLAEIAMTEDEVNIKISTAVGAIDSITTSTGYTFDENGLNISKAGEEMENLLDNTGMYVSRSGEAILTANNEGVDAINLTARQYLIIGNNSRFEDYGADRTGCFWIGG